MMLHVVFNRLRFSSSTLGEQCLHQQLGCGTTLQLAASLLVWNSSAVPGITGGFQLGVGAVIPFAAAC